MKNYLREVLDLLNEGIVFLDVELNIVFWNDYMQQITGMSSSEVINKNIYNILPTLDKNYFRQAINCVKNNGCKMFFSAAMHKSITNSKEKLNLRISKIEGNAEKHLLLEFIDVTNQFVRIDQLKKYVKKLSILNKELKEKEKIIKRLAYYDGLTGVANKILFYKIAKKCLSGARRNKSLLGLVFIDVDNFKLINDTYGHKIGDQVLVEIADLLKSCIRESDLLARFGGDEFIILLPNLKKYDDYKLVAKRIVEAKNKVIPCIKDVRISLSMGFSFYPFDGDNIDDLICEADKAMYRAKKQGGNNFKSSL